ncbi:YebC/PmpR family DNA-binding transcriptional regulator [Candidatus Parcubacteria bacterium]|jgi:YebC/PmpR family DNA-binding regulatory protein|nr:MAG: YebC/PmpR family DNA-binding transcriptional regulator [Candidatus Parcubacteria bacterium]
MSGHSKWSTIKRQKGATDAKRAVLFTKLGHAITASARQGGADPETNFRLRLAIEKARAANMPNENVDRAVRRGLGADTGLQLEEILYEGFGPGGSALLIQAITNNRNRTVGEIRALLGKHEGSLGGANSVAWQFENRGVVRIEAESLRGLDKEKIILEAIEAGAEDVQDSAEGLAIIAPTDKLAGMQKFFSDRQITVASADTEFVAKQNLKLNDADAEKLHNLMEALENHEDVSAVWTNAG